eukprot:1781270-Amphidinium_carterae.1
MTTVGVVITEILDLWIIRDHLWMRKVSVTKQTLLTRCKLKRDSTSDACVPRTLTSLAPIDLKSLWRSHATCNASPGHMVSEAGSY